MIAKQLITRLVVRELGFEQVNPLEIGDSRVGDPTGLMAAFDATVDAIRSVKTETTRSKSPAAKFRKWANDLQREIDQKTAPLSQNWTPKRGRELAVRVHEGNNLKRLQQALAALADAWDDGTIPPGLQCFRAKTDILGMVKTRGDSRGYYDYREMHGEFVDNLPMAKLLREFCGIGTDPVQQKRGKLDQLLNELRMNPPEGFFPTPRAVIEQMIEQVHDKLQKPDVRVLEPSAGIGSITDVVNEVAPHACIHAVEANVKCRAVLTEKGFYSNWSGDVFASGVRWLICQTDYLMSWPGEHYDVILMNPPFENRQDEEHVLHAFDDLRPGGRLVAIVSAGAIQNQRSRSFQLWLSSIDAAWEALPEDCFNTVESFRRTGVRCYMVTINKRD